jgi:hypothetical protein
MTIVIITTATTIITIITTTTTIIIIIIIIIMIIITITITTIITITIITHREGGPEYGADCAHPPEQRIAELPIPLGSQVRNHRARRDLLKRWAVSKSCASFQKFKLNRGSA